MNNSNEVPQRKYRNYKTREADAAGKRGRPIATQYDWLAYLYVRVKDGPRTEVTSRDGTRRFCWANEILIDESGDGLALAWEMEWSPTTERWNWVYDSTRPLCCPDCASDWAQRCLDEYENEDQLPF